MLAELWEKSENHYSCWDSSYGDHEYLYNCPAYLFNGGQEFITNLLVVLREKSGEPQSEWDSSSGEQDCL